MKLVIEISEETYNNIQSLDWKNGERWFSEEWKAIHNGTPHETVTEFADRCRECGREKVLDKIRTEIERLHYHPKLDFIRNDEVVDMALDIIDKYKGKSEDKK